MIKARCFPIKSIKELIATKRDGGRLTAEELRRFAFGAADGSIPDYQVSAMLMAMYLNGLDEEETTSLTLAMADSGDKADLSGIDGVKGDKHSTGGVGDKTTLIVAPIVAECGVKMAKMSGRGLGHTGGTVDKLEAIPNFNSTLTAEKFKEIVNRCGLCITGQSGNLCPADKRLYSLRDATETVSSIPLIASSVMSKKLAGGADCIVLDVKCGSGAFMKDLDCAKQLAETMVKIGKSAGRKVSALITDMDTPLGNCIGNSLEVIEAVETLKGNGPDDLTELSLSLAAKLLSLAGKGSVEECRSMAKSKIDDSSALKRLAESVELQGGDASYILNTDKFPKAPYKKSVTAKRNGYIFRTDAQLIGLSCMLLGAGRQAKDDVIDSSAGIILRKKTGDYVSAGDEIAVMYSSNEALFEAAEERFCSALEFSDVPPLKRPLIFAEVE